MSDPVLAALIAGGMALLTGVVLRVMAGREHRKTTRAIQEIHVIVNSKSAAMVREIAALKAEVRELKGRTK